MAAIALAHYIDIPTKDGSGSFKGYLALPSAGTGSGLVLGQEIFGVNQNMRDVSEMYAEEGYVAPHHGRAQVDDRPG